MAVENGRVSFEAVSEQRTAAWFTRAIGIEPTSADEIGEPVGNGRSGRRHRAALWSLHRDFDGGDNPLNEALVGLLAPFEGRDDTLRAARQWFQLRVRCFGSTDSTQGGFWLGPAVLSFLGKWGVEFHCTVYLEEHET